ncbi:MAG TPA: class I SAM-dependent methyltransferase [Actinomycetota bacterium]|nr:class I SAM-dependent methyltransferase [Actinomycetota bacterium]
MGEDGYFDDHVAASFDETAAEMFGRSTLDPAVDFLTEVADGGPVLEFGSGTGRVALPLAARGLDVHGIELSRAMVAKMRAKPGGDAVDVAIGDLSTTTVDGRFRLVFVVWNTITNLVTQEAQVACFRNASAHLVPGGRFVVEVFVPALQRLPVGERFQVFYGSEGYWGIDEIDVVTQRATSHHLEIVDRKVDRLSVPYRYVWPSELDLMAELADMTLEARYGGWHREPFTAESTDHVSIWRKR